MCTGAELIPILMAGGGTALSMDAQQDAARDQARAAGDRARTADEFNRKAGSRVSEEISRLKSSTSEPEEKAAEGGFMAALRQAQANNGGVSEANTGGASQRFAQDMDETSTANAAGNRGAARSLARIDAPFMQRVREGAGSSRARSDLSVLGNAAQGQDFLQQLRMSMIQPDAGQMALGSLVSSAGQAMGGRMKPVGVPRPRTPILTPGGGFGGGLN